MGAAWLVNGREFSGWGVGWVEVWWLGGRHENLPSKSSYPRHCSKVCMALMPWLGSRNMGVSASLPCISSPPPLLPSSSLPLSFPPPPPPPPPPFSVSSPPLPHLLPSLPPATLSSNYQNPMFPRRITVPCVSGGRGWEIKIDLSRFYWQFMMSTAAKDNHSEPSSLKWVCEWVGAWVGAWVVEWVCGWVANPSFVSHS